jgi:hypothetical protein
VRVRALLPALLEHLEELLRTSPAGLQKLGPGSQPEAGQQSLLHSQSSRLPGNNEGRSSLQGLQVPPHGHRKVQLQGKELHQAWVALAGLGRMLEAWVAEGRAGRGPWGPGPRLQPGEMAEGSVAMAQAGEESSLSQHPGPQGTMLQRGRASSARGGHMQAPHLLQVQEQGALVALGRQLQQVHALQRRLLELMPALQGHVPTAPQGRWQLAQQAAQGNSSQPGEPLHRSAVEQVGCSEELDPLERCGWLAGWGRLPLPIYRLTHIPGLVGVRAG